MVESSSSILVQLGCGLWPVRRGTRLTFSTKPGPVSVGTFLFFTRTEFQLFCWGTPNTGFFLLNYDDLGRLRAFREAGRRVGFEMGRRRLHWRPRKYGRGRKLQLGWLRDVPASLSREVTTELGPAVGRSCWSLHRTLGLVDLDRCPYFLESHPSTDPPCQATEGLRAFSRGFHLPCGSGARDG
jgi:hypothetical protein